MKSQHRKPQASWDFIPAHMLHQIDKSHRQQEGDVPCQPTISAFERSSKRRKGYPSEQRVKKGDRVVHGNKELFRKTRP
jgi:hypothetical protein